MLKAISASLLMEQVIAPNFKFKTKRSDDDRPDIGDLKIKGFKEPSTARVQSIVESDLNDLNDLNDLKAQILQDQSGGSLLPPRRPSTCSPTSPSPTGAGRTNRVGRARSGRRS